MVSRTPRHEAEAKAKGAKNVLDDYDDAGSNPASPGSPRGKKGTPTSGGRKVSRAGSGQKPRAQSQSQRDAPNTKRPGTSSGGTPTGSITRPSTSHSPPDGDPPWLATMYKPDPMLPPDQQMLPTHAKRLAQEQWGKEGTAGSVYDREFRLLSPNGFAQPPASQQRDNGNEQLSLEREEGTWPLAAAQTSEKGGGRTTGLDAGRVVTAQKHNGQGQGQMQQQRQEQQHQQQYGQPQFGNISSSKTNVAPPSQTIRVQDPPGKEGKEKGCRCVIM